MTSPFEDPPSLPPRRAVQFCVTPETEESWAKIYALADDGTIWRNMLTEGSPAGWVEFVSDPLPQPEAVASED